MGRILGLDPGSKRIGVAISDGLLLTARPLEVVDTAVAAERVLELVEEHRVERIVVGLPISLAGEEGPAAQAARDLAVTVAAATGLPVDVWDERFTTTVAEAALIEQGVERRARRRMVDKVAASVMLQNYLEARRHEPRKPDHDRGPAARG
jgi:putative Holliday junction resolvase